MVGYIRAHKPEMKIKEYETYRAFYCSLCRTLGKRYGQPARLLLSYDLTFLILFICCVKDETVSFQPGRCPFNPSKRCAYCDPAQPLLAYAADLTVLITYYKLQDTIEDGGFFKKIAAYLLLPYLSHLHRKAKKRCPEEDKRTARYLAAQFKAEHSPLSTVDAAAQPTADYIADLAAKNASEQNRAQAAAFGRLLGRYIYLADALDDLKKDIKTGNFNPFIQTHHISKDNLTETFPRCKNALELTIGALIDAYETLPKGAYSEITENVIRMGLYEQADRIYSQMQEVRE